MGMTSYQRKKRTIAYLSQSLKESRALCASIVGHARKDGHDIKIPLAYRGIGGNDFITDTPDFSMWLSMSSPDTLIEASRK